MAGYADSRPIISATQEAEAGRSQVLGCLCHRASSSQFSLGNLVRPWLKMKRAKGLVSLLRVGHLSSLCRVLYPALERKGGETENLLLTDQGTHVCVPLGEALLASRMLWECGDSPHSLGKSSLRAEGVVLFSASSEDTLPPCPGESFAKIRGLQARLGDELL